MANAASATCAWSETSDEGFDGIDAPRGWPAGNREPARRNRGRSDEPREKRRGFAQRNRRSTARIFGAPEKKSHVGGSDDWNLFFFSRPPRNERRRRASGPGEALVLDASGARARASLGSCESVSCRGHARAHTFSSRRAGSLRPSRAHRPRRRVSVSREGRRRDAFHLLQRLQRDFLFRVSARRRHGRGLNPQKWCQRRVVLLHVRALLQHLRPQVEICRCGRVSGCPGTPGINRGAWRNGKRESACSFPGDSGLTTYRFQGPRDRVSARLASWVAQHLMRGDAHGDRSRQQVVIPQHHLRLRVHRVHTRFGVVSRFGSAISREVGTRTGTQAELSRCAVCAREARRRRVR